MSKELIVSTGKHETRVAILEDDQLVEIFHEREKEYSLAGSIHKGRVTRVLPGMQSAFVDIGLERDAFLYVSDFFEDNDEYDAVVSTVEDKVLKMEKGGGTASGDRRSESPVPPEDAEPEVIAASPVIAPPVVERREERRNMEPEEPTEPAQQVDQSKVLLELAKIHEDLAEGRLSLEDFEVRQEELRELLMID